MKKIPLILIGILLAWPNGAGAGVIAPDLESEIRALPTGAEVAVIIRLTETVNLKSFTDKNKAVRSSKIIKALIDRQNRTQKDVLQVLKKNKAKEILSLWIINGIAAQVPASLVGELANLPSVDRVTLDAVVTLPPEPVEAGTTGIPAVIRWNIDAMRAPELWGLGYDGSGVVVGIMDSGVNAAHPDIGPRYRGGNNSWYDPSGVHSAPFDATGHGTQVTGIIVGGDAGGSAIGVAPGAQWIAVKIFDDGGKSDISNIHSGFQWILNPDGNPDTPDFPDIVNNSWYLEGTEGQCENEFSADIAALNSAGITVVFSAGNSGPDGNTSVSPGNNSGSLAVGAVQQDNVIAYFSSRGPSACDGSLYPQIAAPGVFIYTAIYSDQYTGATGTSFAAPHVAGALALLTGAVTDASVSQLQAALEEGAIDLGAPGPDNTYGHGLLNTQAAYDWLLDNVGSPFDSDNDGDVDGRDLAAYAAIATGGDLAAVAYSFDRSVSQL